MPNGDVIAGGNFRVADGAVVNHLARWDGTTWHGIGGGFNNQINAIVRMPNGDLVAAGMFSSAGGVPANAIARWNGVSWAPLGSGIAGSVLSLLALPNGDLVAGGVFAAAGGVPADRIARWDGSAWSSIGTGFVGDAVRALASMPNGDIVAAGQLVSAASSSGTYGLQRYDGVTWRHVPGLDAVAYPVVTRVVTLANGNLALFGSFSVGSVPGEVAIWHAATATMQLLPKPVGGTTCCLLAASNGELWIGGASNATQPSLARWNGTAWSPVAGAPGNILTLAEDGAGRVIVGANPTTPWPNTHAASRYDGVAWQSLGGTTPPPIVQAIVELSNGDVVVGGRFSTFRGVAANNLARWNGTSWSAIGPGVDGEVRALAALPGDGFVVAGLFAQAGGAPAQRVARFDGQHWSTLGAGLATLPSALAVTTHGSIFAASSSPLGLHRFDGLQWQPVPFAGGAWVLSIAALADDSLAIGGTFYGYPPGTTGLLLWSNGALATVAGAPTVVNRLTRLSDDSLLVGGISLQRWDGSVWSAVPMINAGAIRELPDGGLVGCNGPAAYGGGLASAVYRLRGAGWESFGQVEGGVATQVLSSKRGELFLGGTFQTVGGNAVSVGFAQAMPTCPATAASIGAGCTGGAGPVTLQANSSAWIGGTFRATVAGMTLNSLAVQAFGLLPAVQPLPGGAPGCSLFLQPDFSTLLVPIAGHATAAWPVPNEPSAIGLAIRTQAVGVELGSLGIVRLTSSNALALTIGAL
ncbi:MAG: hypothetical protein KF830_13285 [Planctomycetes bacterium]|nr:hypothetical protein [Planctomycetota bacterium]